MQTSNGSGMCGEHGHSTEGQPIWIDLCPLFNRVVVFHLTESKAIPVTS